MDETKTQSPTLQPRPSTRVLHAVYGWGTVVSTSGRRAVVVQWDSWPTGHTFVGSWRSLREQRS